MYVHIAGPAGAPTLLLLHATGTSGWMWEPIVDRLGAYRCLVPDLPGHGRSNTVPWQSLDHTVDALARRLREHAPAGCAHVVGLSMGAYIGLRLMAQHPALVDRVVLSGLNVLPFPHPRLMQLAGYLMAPLLKRDVVLKAQARALRIPPEQQAGYRQAARAMSLRAFLRIGHDLMNFSLTPDLKDARTSTLVIAGEREHPLIQQSIPKLLSTLPEAVGYRVPGVGHAWSGEAPDLFVRTVTAWLETQPLPPELIPVPAS